jgi:hypothetical protein
MPNIMRLHRDWVEGFGIAVTTPNQGVYVNSERAVVVGGFVTPHHQPDLLDGPVPMVEGSPDVFFERIPVCRVDDRAQCGHRCVVGSPDTFAN